MSAVCGRWRGVVKLLWLSGAVMGWGRQHLVEDGIGVLWLVKSFMEPGRDSRGREVTRRALATLAACVKRRPRPWRDRQAGARHGNHPDGGPSRRALLFRRAISGAARYAV